MLRCCRLFWLHDRYGSVFEAAVDEMFRQSKLTSDHKFLDIGCGIGSIVLQAAGWAGCQAAVSARPTATARPSSTQYRAIDGRPSVYCVLLLVLPCLLHVSYILLLLLVRSQGKI